jgi:hypothetical protein
MTAPSAATDAAPAWLAGSSITGIAEVLPMRVGSRASQTLFEAAGLLDAWRQRPQGKVADAELRRLHQVLRDALGLPAAREVARDAGVRAAEPACDFVCALLERLASVLVRAGCRVVETDCESCGAAACRFELRW